MVRNHRREVVVAMDHALHRPGGSRREQPERLAPAGTLVAGARRDRGDLRPGEIAGAHPFDRERRIAVLPVVFVHQQRRPGVLQDVAQVAAGNVQRQDHRDEADVHGAEYTADQKLGVAQTQHHPIPRAEALCLQRLAGANHQIRKLAIGNPPPLAQDRIAVADALQMIIRKEHPGDVAQRRSPYPGRSFTPRANPIADRAHAAISLVRTELAIVHNRRME